MQKSNYRAVLDFAPTPSWTLAEMVSPRSASAMDCKSSVSSSGGTSNGFVCLTRKDGHRRTLGKGLSLNDDLPTNDDTGSKLHGRNV